MGRTPCCDKKGLKQGKWSTEEDQKLIFHIQRYGHRNWSTLPILAGLLRCGKSCRHRWTNYLRPGIKRESFTIQEEEAIIKLHQILGNRWSAIARELPGRTNNDIKNFWHKHQRKRQLNNTVMASTNETNICDIINNNNEGDSRVNNEPESKSAENNITTTATMVAVVQEGDRYKGENVGNDSLDYNEDIWDDLLSDASLCVTEKSGFEALTMAATPVWDDKTNTHTWWLDNDDDDNDRSKMSWN